MDETQKSTTALIEWLTDEWLHVGKKKNMTTLMYDDARKQGLRARIDETDGGRNAVAVVTTNANQPGKPM